MSSVGTEWAYGVRWDAGIERMAVCHGAFAGDQPVEPGDVLGHAVRRVLHDRAGIDVELDVGPLGLGQALDQLGPAALEQGQPGLGGEMPGEGETEPEAAGVVERAAVGQELDEELPALLGDPVDLLAPAGVGGGVAAGPQHGQLPAERAGRRGLGGGCGPGVPVLPDLRSPLTAPAFSSRVRAG